MITVPNTYDSTLVIDGVSHCNRSSWIKEGLNLRSPWSTFFSGKVPKTRKALAKEGIVLSKAAYNATVVRNWIPRFTQVGRRVDLLPVIRGVLGALTWKH